MNNKGVALPLVIIIVLLFLVAPVVYFYSIKPSDTTQEVKGSSNLKSQDYDNGVGFYINSKYGTWDLLVYLCQDKNNCTSSLMSGKRTDTISGGETDNFPIRIVPNSSWDSNKYIKAFARSAWGSPEREFTVSMTLDPINDAEVVQMEYDGSVYNVLLVPTEYFTKTFSNIAIFSD